MIDDHEHHSEPTWRLDHPSVMRWAENVLRDHRGAQPETHTGRPEVRAGSTQDLQGLSGDLGLQKMGDAKSRPSIRSHRRRVDTKTTLAEAQVPMNIHDVTGAHLEALIMMYRKHGHILPRLWAESPVEIALLEPNDWDALEIQDWAKVQMLLGAVRGIGATIGGRCDEIYFRDARDGGSKAYLDRLAEMVDYDPAIRTGLFVHALDFRTTEVYRLVGTFDLDSEGLPFWERHDGDFLTPFMIPLWGVGRMLQKARKQPLIDLADAERIAGTHNWSLRVINKSTT